jgi:hypothetical protein
MINHFLATLDNNPIAPGGFVWPEFTERVVSPEEASIRATVIGTGLSREEHFLRCLQLTALVAESPLTHHITAKDHRVTYSPKAIQDRLALSGIVVQYTGSNSNPSSLNLVINSDTPDTAEWTVTLTSTTTATTTDDLGNSRPSSFSMNDGISSLINLPLDRGAVRVYGNAPQTGDSWTVSYKRHGANWVADALDKLDRVNPAAVLTPELMHWYLHTPLKLDRLAAVVVGLADR